MKLAELERDVVNLAYRFYQGYEATAQSLGISVEDLKKKLEISSAENTAGLYPSTAENTAGIAPRPLKDEGTGEIKSITSSSPKPNKPKPKPKGK
jgi:hypothetical protein